MSVKGSKRTGKLGTKDKVLDKVCKRKNYEASLLQQGSAAPGEESPWVTEAEMEEAMEAGGSAGAGVPPPLQIAPEEGCSSDFIPDTEVSNKARYQRRCKQKIDIIPDSVYLIADKYGISNRALMELVVALIDGDFKDYNISVKTIERRRAKVRLKNC